MGPTGHGLTNLGHRDESGMKANSSRGSMCPEKKASWAAAMAVGEVARRRGETSPRGHYLMNRENRIKERAKAFSPRMKTEAEPDRR